jgi:hypothetical protein
LFFPPSDPNTATLASLATFAIAFIARPIGSIIFGHFGDRVGRKTTLVAALLTMGVSTVMIGILPTYETLGIAAPVLLALCRFGQGLVLAASGEVRCCSRPRTRRPASARGTACSRSSARRSASCFRQRLPAAVAVSHRRAVLSVRLAHSVPRERVARRDRSVRSADDHRDADLRRGVEERRARVKVPRFAVFRDHPLALLRGMMISIIAYTLFYMHSVFSLSWGTSQLATRALNSW